MPVPPRRRWHAPAGLLALVAVVATVTSCSAGPQATLPVAASVTAPPASAPPATAAAAPSAASAAVAAPPRAGTVRLVAGPFTDRLHLQRLTVVRRPGVAVSGSFAQVADVSELLDLEVRADFYDDSGRLLGSRTTVLGQSDVIRTARGGAGPDRSGGDVAFTVSAPAAVAARVSSALVSIPMLVNE